jgi:hypothetical protein
MENRSDNVEEAGCPAPICSAEGELIVWEEEGGYCSPYLGLKPEEGDEVSFEELIERLIPGVVMSGGKKGVRIRLTLEILQQNTKARQPDTE